MPSPYSAKLKTPFAVLGVRTANGVVTRIQYLPTSERVQAPTDWIAERAVREVERYLADPHFRFSLPLASIGTPFRRRVWESLSEIPVGESRTYGELARTLHTAARAIGGACAANEIALVVPCHRVVGSQGSLGGFMSAKGRPERELLPLGGKARSAKGALISEVDGDPHRDQALAAEARGLSLRRVTRSSAAAVDHDANADRADRCVLRPGLASGRTRAVIARELSPRPDAMGRLARPAAAVLLLTAQRGDVEAFLAEQFRAKAKATSIARRLSSLRRFYALQLLQGTLRADPTLRVRAPKLPRRLPKNLSEVEVEALLARPRHRNHARPARPRDAGNAVCDRLARVRAGRPHARPGVARHGRRASARQRQQGAARPAGRGVDRVAQALSRRRPAAAPRHRQERSGVRHCAPRSADAAGVLGAVEAPWREGGHSLRPACRRTCCATRSRPISSTTAPICASCSSCSATPTSRRRRSTRTSRGSASSASTRGTIRAAESRLEPAHGEGRTSGDRGRSGIAPSTASPSLITPTNTRSAAAPPYRRASSTCPSMPSSRRS